MMVMMMMRCHCDSVLVSVPLCVRLCVCVPVCVALCVFRCEPWCVCVRVGRKHCSPFKAAFAAFTITDGYFWKKAGGAGQIAKCGAGAPLGRREHFAIWPAPPALPQGGGAIFFRGLFFSPCFHSIGIVQNACFSLNSPYVLKIFFRNSSCPIILKNARRNWSTLECVFAIFVAGWLQRDEW